MLSDALLIQSSSPKQKRISTNQETEYRKNAEAKKNKSDLSRNQDESFMTHRKGCDDLLEMKPQVIGLLPARIP